MASPSGLVYRVLPELVDSIVSHKFSNQKEVYLVRWKSNRPRDAVLSWHDLTELYLSLHLVQDYVKAALASSKPPPITPPEDRPLKNGIHDSQRRSHEVYNGRLQRKSGILVAKESSDPIILRVDALQIPDAAMLVEASNTSVFNALYHIRNKFIRSLSQIPGPKVSFENLDDVETPSLHFQWIKDYVLGEGVAPRLSDEFLEGCTKCKPDMGAQRGCEYTQKCACLEYAAPDPSKKMDDEQIAIYQEWLANGGDGVDTTGLPKRFPYRATGAHAGCLESFYLNSRFVIYECNPKCKCGPKCKTRNVQFGRKVELEIFRTPGRGFGLRCPQPLQRGQFIDKYLGELITDSEADRREAAAGGQGKASYLFWLDKHMVVDDDDSNSSSSSSLPGLRQSDCVVADGETMGGPTRFINHSCDPNVRLFTVSYNKHDERIYDLAFFALHDIPAGEELTFDYVDPEPDEDEGQAKENQARKLGEMEKSGNMSRVPCLCGAVNCRGYMWE